MNDLQHYFEQQNDKEAASIVADVLALLPSHTSVVNWENQGDVENNGKVEATDKSMALNNILLTKESEIAALKEVILKWRNRALEAETKAQLHYIDQFDLIQLEHQKELRSMESRYMRKLSEKEDVILNLEEQVGYLVSRRSSLGDTDSFTSNMDQDYQDDEDDNDYDDEDEDMDSIISSIYDRDAEQQLILIESTPAAYPIKNTTSNIELKSEAILDSIQDTMRAIEQELSNKTRNHRRSPSHGTYFSSATLIESESSISDATKKMKKSAFSINRIFKKAFPKLYNKTNFKYTKHQQFLINSFPRSDTDETFAVCSTVANQESSIHMNFSTLNHQPQQTMII